jgi:hypothetical protein
MSVQAKFLELPSDEAEVAPVVTAYRRALTNE